MNIKEIWKRKFGELSKDMDEEEAWQAADDYCEDYMAQRDDYEMQRRKEMRNETD